ncbi:MAG: hypothetical protein U0W40_05735 [Acidimicrobiia bacterium]
MIVDDLFAEGTHLNDITVVSPVLAGQEPSVGGEPRTTPTSAVSHRDRCRLAR